MNYENEVVCVGGVCVGERESGGVGRERVCYFR
jgi:hypothetical protein